MKPIIGIVGRPTNDSCFPLISVHDEYRKAVIDAGGIPFLILPSQNLSYEDLVSKKSFQKEEKENLKKVLDLCDGILMTGGDLIFPQDLFIYDYVLKTKKPYFGICLGMQIMVGEDNLARIDTPSHHSKEKYVHSVHLMENTKLKSIFGCTTLKVNSRHHDCVINPKDYRIGALSVDGVIEALERSDYAFHIGVQWHPESMVDYDDGMKKLFQAFIASCYSWR